MKNRMGRDGLIITTTAASQVGPGPALIIFGTPTPSAPVAFLPLQIEEILFAIVLIFEIPVKLLHCYSLEHTLLFSPKLK
jgi:hypothetical protein